jgi:hypothetical protein
MAITDQIWSAYANARAMRYQPGRASWAAPLMPRLDGHVGVIAVALQLLDESDSNRFWAGAIARPSVPLRGHVEGARTEIFDRIARLFGARGIAVGEDAFDRAFTVRATEESTARALLNAPITREMLELGAKYFAYDDGGGNGGGAVAVVYVPFEVHDFPAIDRALALVAAIAQTAPAGGAYR